MAYRGQEIKVFDLTGGQASNRPVTGLEQNQALELDNMHSLPGGGIELRQGDAEINSVAFAAGAAFTGLEYFKLSTGTEFLVGVAGTAVGKMDYAGGVPDGIIDVITGAVVVTASQDNLWTSFVAADEVYFVGGAPDASFSWDGIAGTASAVGGTFPSGDFGFFHNNRIFIGIASTSELKHSTLTNIEDFTGDGAGSLFIDSKNKQALIGAAPLNTDVVLLFKKNSIHQLLTTSAPFSRFPLFPDVGAVGKKAIVTHEGIAYFITPQARMKATNGSEIVDFSPDIDDVWDSIPKPRLPFIQGYFEQGKNFRHIKWVVSKDAASTTNDFCIVWDLDKKSWWTYSTGHDINAVTTDTADNIIYAGHYDGKIYQKNVMSLFTDASEASAGISGFWAWGWQTNQSFQNSLHPQRLNVSMLGQTSGELRVQYGFDFISNTKTVDVSMQLVGSVWDTDIWDIGAWGGQTDLIRNIFLFGRGNAFQVKFSNKTAGVPFRVNAFTVAGKPSSQKEFAAS